MATTTNFGWTTPDNTALVKDGASAIRSLGSAIDTSLGGSWTSYTPTWINVTTGNGTVNFKYKQINKLVFVRGKFTMGSTSSISGLIVFSVPVASVALDQGFRYGLARIQDTGTTSYEGLCAHYDTNNAYLVVGLANGTYLQITNTSATVPMTWTNTDFFDFEFFYEAA